MVTYTAHERDSDLTDISARAEAVVFVKEGFAWLAMLFPIIWLLFHQMWIVLAVFVAIFASVEAGVMSMGLSDEVAMVTSLGMSGILALLANDLRRWSLARRGYRLVELVSGRDSSECEERFFTEWLASQGAERKSRPKTTEPTKPIPVAVDETTPSGDDIIGLFPEPGK